ncbi:hypothetical protein F3157_11585 [Virgibacillus dakarensis]|uniref:DUF6220 domain-containing protein n=1 Tax=Bacillaceae TaxID=186817 RepID=UPI000C82DD43|nr:MULTISPECIES: DUF6220 domain-containing protein [Bacillaceae]MBT2217460.1 hypothetical protein [Virgibacillus dakarensis]MTW86294.1 hypothetical protein [Virgibacillus dakarensis]
MNVKNRIGQTIYFVLALLFLLCIMIQIFLAGLAIFANPVHWIKHTMFIHLFGFNIPLFMLLSAYIGRMPRWSYWSIFGMFVSVFLMYFTANMSAQFPWIAAAHPVVAMLLFIISLVTVLTTWKLIVSSASKKGGD